MDSLFLAAMEQQLTLAYVFGAIVGGAVALIVCRFCYKGRKSEDEDEYEYDDEHEGLPPLRPRELQAALLVGDDHPLWRAMLQSIEVLREAADREAVDVVNHQRPPLPSYYAGAVAHLDQLKGFLHEQREMAKKRAESDE